MLFIFMASKIDHRAKKFYKHLIIYAGTNFTLFVINALISKSWWFWIITVLWGLGLMWHGLAILIKQLGE